LHQITDGFADLGNTKVGDMYIFSGQAVDTKPVVKEADPVTGVMRYVYKGSTGTQADLVRQIAPGVDIATNVTAEQLLFGASDLLPALESLSCALDVMASETSTELERLAAIAIIKGDPAGLPPVEAALGRLSTGENEIMRLYTDVGARMKRLDAAVARNNSMVDGLTKLVSKQEDLDVPKAILELATADSSYKMSLQMGARLVQPTLLDFLR
jgi:flagellar hook-associated protein 3 FlgL